MGIFRHTLVLGAAICGIGLSGCQTLQTAMGPSSNPEGVTASKPSFNRFTDIPVPSNAAIDLDRTLVFGGDDSWTGRLVFNSSHSANDLFDLFKQEFPKFAWREITSVRSAISVLTFSRSGRIATVQLQAGNMITGTEAIITVSPEHHSSGATVQNPVEAPNQLPRMTPYTTGRTIR